MYDFALSLALLVLVNMLVNLGAIQLYDFRSGWVQSRVLVPLGSFYILMGVGVAGWSIATMAKASPLLIPLPIAGSLVWIPIWNRHRAKVRVRRNYGERGWPRRG